MENFFFTWNTHTLTFCLPKFSVCTAFIGNKDSCTPNSIQIFTNDDLETIAENTQNSWLMHYVLMNQIYTLYFSRQHLAVTKVAEKYETTQKGKRALDFIIQYFQGLSKHAKSTLPFSSLIGWLLVTSDPRVLLLLLKLPAALCLARQTKDKKWREIGEEAVKSFTLLARHGTWNFEHKVCAFISFSVNCS